MHIPITRNVLPCFALVAACLLASQTAGAADAAPATPNAPTTMTQTAKGTFEVQLAGAPAAEGTEAAKIGRMSIRKQFHGDMEGTSLGEMLAVRTSVAESAGYVAMERVEAKLAGKTGSFAFMHLGEMNRGQQHLTVQVIPDSATGDLVGLSGSLTIDIKDGKHFYVFSYQLPAR